MLPISIITEYDISTSISWFPIKILITSNISGSFAMKQQWCFANLPEILQVILLLHIKLIGIQEATKSAQ
jgi:hypothetical protein